MSADEMGYIATGGGGGRPKVYHTSRDCDQLNGALNVLEYPVAHINDRRRPCQYCTGNPRGGDATQERECPFCGEPTTHLGSHLRKTCEKVTQGGEHA